VSTHGAVRVLNALRRLFGAAPAEAPPPDHRQQGNDFVAQGRFEDAARCYALAVEDAPADVSARVGLGFALMELGRLDDARHALQDASRLDPNQHDAHFLLARMARARGDEADALAAYARAIAAAPGFELAHVERAQLLLASGDAPQARRLLEEAARQRHDFADARMLLARTCLEAHDLPAAREWLLQVIASRPEDASAHAQLGEVCGALGERDAARDAYRKALTHDPRNVHALLALGDMALAQQDAGDAQARYSALLEVLPQHPGALTGLARSLVALGRYEEGRTRYEQVLAQDPHDPAALLGLGNCWLGQDRNEAALAAYDRVLAIDPQHAQAHLNRGNALQALHRDEEARASFEAALRARPGYVDALVNLAGLLQSHNAFAEAIALHREALANDSQCAAAHWNLALCELVLGQLEDGFREAEWRWQALGRQPLRSAQPRWTGAEDLAGKTLLVYAEQGLGDTLQFCRYASLAAARGARVLLSVQPALRRLVGTLAAPVTFVDSLDPPPAHDLHCALLSLPLAFRTSLATIPAAVPYLHARDEVTQRWKERLARVPGLKVGLAWSGNPVHVNDRNRSLPFATIARLASPGVSLVSLQKEVRDGDQAALSEAGVAHFGDLLTDFEATAGLVAALDLVITVDTSVAHLAGALGKPVWILLPFSPDWRWMLERQDTPWYPSARLFRQPRIGEWESVIEAVRAALADLTPRR
jgi:tetratricopeptide (TPR) repeat protein